MFANNEHFKLGVTLRNVILIISLLANSEAWYELKMSEIKSLEKVDDQFLRGIVKGHRMTPQSLLYLELGVLPRRYIIKSRRLNSLTKQVLMHK